MLIESIAAQHGINLQTAREWALIQSKTADVVEAMQQRLGGRSAGGWFDNETGQRVIPTVREEDGAAARRYARERGLDADEVRFPVVRYPLGQLEGTLRTAASSSRVHQLLSEDMVRLSIDVPENVVAIEASTLARNGREHLEREFKDNDAIAVLEVSPDQFGARPDACGWAFLNSNCDRPLRGGVTITPSVGGRCSAGALAFRGGDRFLMTAGHCIRQVVSGTWTAFHPNSGLNRLIGPSGGFTYGNDFANGGVSRDSGAINVSTGSFWRQSPWPAESYADHFTNHYPTQALATGATGDGMCHLGSATPNNSNQGNCGTITAQNVTVTYNDPNSPGGTNTLSDMTQTNYCGGGGDSGGPVVSNYILLGLHSGSGGTLAGGNCVGYFENSARVQQSHGVTLRGGIDLRRSVASAVGLLAAISMMAVLATAAKGDGTQQDKSQIERSARIELPRSFACVTALFVEQGLELHLLVTRRQARAKARAIVREADAESFTEVDLVKHRFRYKKMRRIRAVLARQAATFAGASARFEAAETDDPDSPLGRGDACPSVQINLLTRSDDAAAAKRWAKKAQSRYGSDRVTIRRSDPPDVEPIE